ncbi:hypothetical protein [Microbacterium sp. cx-55]|uniref:hypothetical protein n=1 Tax=Microbacterium sp. cx-55 TaxID=2875948 RepID=UPI001CBB1382|nr:hypothetical protein [Microbacterium sp. cx-55]MBZ4486278.1 hypothetical protein [Microbacterium sp. cx-55]
MTAPRIERAQRLVSELRDVLDAADLSDVIATLDAAEVPSGARHGIVVVAAPKLSFDGPFSMVGAVYEVHVIAGPSDNYLAAWERIDTIIQALVEGHVNLSSGEPGGYEPMRGDTIPAYTLELNDLD